jgi:mannosyltransferase OCH1-like enzyme
MPKDIPKIIWQTHNYLYEELPEHLKQVTRTWINLNPTWEYRYVNHLDRAEFVKKEDPVLYSSYHKISPVDQSDVWRALVTYKYGGAYADMDSVCKVPLDYMLDTLQCDHDLLATSQGGPPPYDYNWSNFVVGKKSKNLKTIIENMKDENYLQGFLGQWAAPLEYFCKQAQTSDTVCKDFDGANHYSVYKVEFNDNFYVNYYGKIIPYPELMSELKLAI